VQRCVGPVARCGMRAVRFCPEDGHAAERHGAGASRRVSAVAPPALAATETAAAGQRPSRPPRPPAPRPLAGRARRSHCRRWSATRYRLEEVRGGGGMAKVVPGHRPRRWTARVGGQAHQPGAAPRTRVRRPASTARRASPAQLNDPHIVVVHDFGIDLIHGPYLVMEFPAGHDRCANGWRRRGRCRCGPGIQLSAQLMLALDPRPQQETSSTATLNRTTSSS